MVPQSQLYEETSLLGNKEQIPRFTEIEYPTKSHIALADI